MLNDIERNIRAHNKISKKYETIHGEIYNNFEQARLHKDLSRAVTSISTKNKTKKALDFGCGAGNLTSHLASLGCDVIASDVSQGFLDLVSSRVYDTKIETILLNGVNLSNIPDNSLDMVATYSVLHHVPDYFGVLNEFMRVLKNGGVIYIDHEPSKEYWDGKEIYKNFLTEIKKSSPFDLKKYLSINNYLDYFIRKYINPRYRREGDIHVFTDDHIEWEKIINMLSERGGVISFQDDYLLFRRNYNKSIYDKYVNKITDMHVLAMVKTQRTSSN